MITRSGQYSFVNREYKITGQIYFPAIVVDTWWLIPMKRIYDEDASLPYYGPYEDPEAAMAMGALLEDKNG